jgi:glycosyltransferase involved in cell wall biosynthesis
MRIGIDGLHLFGSYAGIKWSVANLAQALRAHYPADEIVLYVPRNFRGPPEAGGDGGLKICRTWFPGGWRAIRTLWRNFRLQNRAYHDGCQILHGPAYALPSLLSLPGVVTVHDLIAFSHPQFCTPGSARAQKKAIERSAKTARRIIAPSLATKAELQRYLRNLPDDRIDVIPWGVSDNFKPLAEADRQAARATLKLPEEYVLFVGNLEPKKNIPMLIQAFFAAKMHRRLPHKLVLAGQLGWGLKGLEKLIRELEAREYVLFTGYVNPAALPALYNLAALFVMPSAVEGFGLPALEAMACGCPVVTSADPALQEVCGSAARIIEPNAAKALQPWREVFEDLLLKNTGQRTEMAHRGLERAKLFTWERTARLTHACYEKAL